MSLFAKKSGYVSEFTRFIDELRQHNPNLEAQQQTGRARLWDRPKLDLDEMRRTQESRVKPKAYAYQSN